MNFLSFFPVIEPLYVNCPPDIQATLPSDANEISLGALFQRPQSNANASKIQSFPDNIGPDYKFRFGKTLVSYLASKGDEQVSCSHFVEIKGLLFFIYMLCNRSSINISIGLLWSLCRDKRFDMIFMLSLQ